MICTTHILRPTRFSDRFFYGTHTTIGPFWDSKDDANTLARVGLLRVPLCDEAALVRDLGVIDFGPVVAGSGAGVPIGDVVEGYFEVGASVVEIAGACWRGRGWRRWRRWWWRWW